MILLLFLFGLALGAVIPSDDQRVKLQQGSCPMSWYSFSGRCYKYISTRMTWADAEVRCISEGAHLVSIHSFYEHLFVKSLINRFDSSARPTWIGFHDLYQEGTWMWSDGSPVIFNFWDRGQPDNAGGWENCGVTNWGVALKWNDYSCSYSFPSVCTLR